MRHSSKFREISYRSLEKVGGVKRVVGVNLNTGDSLAVVRDGLVERVKRCLPSAGLNNETAGLAAIGRSLFICSTHRVKWVDSH